MLMAMCERFTGCRILSYCLMSNHLQILLEVTPVPEDGISNEELFARMRVFHNEAEVAEIWQEMADADAAKYRWNSYGEAIGGGKKAMARSLSEKSC